MLLKVSKGFSTQLEFSLAELEVGRLVFSFSIDQVVQFVNLDRKIMIEFFFGAKAVSYPQEHNSLPF